MMKLNKKHLMSNAWSIFRKEKNLSFGEALHRAWLSAKAGPENARRIAEAKAVAGIEEEVRTWFGWKQAGFMVKHGSKNLFQVVLIYGSKGDGATYKASFFGASQVEATA